MGELRLLFLILKDVETVVISVRLVPLVLVFY